MTRTQIVETIVAPLVVAAVLALAAWTWSLQTTNAAQDIQIARHDVTLLTLDRDIERVLAKLDQILSELREGK